MSYIGISIKDAMEKINTSWFLPAVQRPYVWGNRYESEKFICKLFDSLFQQYPIGGLILWHNKMSVAHREFLKDFHQGDIYKNVDEGLFQRDKSLIYDGQQRLQTLYSCLRYSFNDRLLVFNLIYNDQIDEDGCTGFRFIDKNESPNEYEIKVNSLFCINSDELSKKTEIRKKYQSKCINGENDENLIENNLDRLWDVFVKKESKSLAFFEIDSKDENKVNDIFERLNTGGIPLSKADLLYSRIKAEYPDFEAEIMTFSKELSIRRKLAFDSYDILQVLNVIVKSRSRIDETVTKEQIEKFKTAWEELKAPLNAFFDDYLYGHFKITHMAIIRNKIPVIVLIVFFYYYYKAGFKWKKADDTLVKSLDKFFIVAELNDWTLQSYADNFCRIINENLDKSRFPYQEIENYVRGKGNRNIEIKETIFKNYLWFSLKIAMPEREFDFDYTMPNRFNPELDHIFPMNLSGAGENYKAMVDVIWNMQPVKGEINNHKTNIHPFEYFTDKCKDSKGLVISGSKNYPLYDYLPPMNEQMIWNDAEEFIKYRKAEILKVLQGKYSIELKPELTNEE